jgi:hypothetical protein
MMDEVCADIPRNSVSRMSGRVEIKTAGRTTDHWCCCVLTPGHMDVIPRAGHGCPCGAIWGRDQLTVEESE